MKAPREQAESIVEAIVRYQDLFFVGNITAVGQLLQLATIFGMYMRNFDRLVVSTYAV